MKRINKEATREMVFQELKRTHCVNTHHLSDFFAKFGALYEDYDTSQTLIQTQSRLRTFLNKMVKDGLLVKVKYTGVGFLGRIDFGYSHSSDYITPKFADECGLFRGKRHVVRCDK